MRIQTRGFFVNGPLGTFDGARYAGANPTFKARSTDLHDTVTSREQNTFGTPLAERLALVLASVICSCRLQNYQDISKKKQLLFWILAMQITTHRSEKQMQRDYNLRPGTSDSRAETVRLMNKFASGQMVRMPHNGINFVRSLCYKRYECLDLDRKSILLTSILEFPLLLSRNQKLTIVFLLI